MTDLENMTSEELEAALLKKRKEESTIEPEPVPEPQPDEIITSHIEEEPALRVVGDVVVEEPLPTPEPEPEIPITIQADIGEIIEEMEPEEEIIIEYNPQKALELLKQSDTAFSEFVKAMGLRTDGIRMNWEAGYKPLKEAILYLDPPEE